MPKSKKRPGRPTPPRRLVEGLNEAFDLLDEGKLAEARPILEGLDRAYPNNPEVLSGLVEACAGLKDRRGHEDALRRLIRLEPNDPDVAYALAGAYMGNFRPALARRGFKEALRRWPSHPHAADAREAIALAESFVRDQVRDLPMDDERAFDLMTLHDEARLYMAQSDFRQARMALEGLLRRYPGFIPALNNLAQIHAVEGRLEGAIQVCLEVLAVQPDNIHALSNLARLHFLSGRPDQARHYADLLKASPAEAADRWTKIAEALTFLEDDAGVLALHDQAKAAGELDTADTGADFYHLLAAAACFLGKEKDARKFWQKALQRDPAYAWARQNLDDLDLPDDERTGAWAYPFENWLQAGLFKDLDVRLKATKPERKAQLQEQLTRFFDEGHPEALFLAPHLAARGDEKARQFVVHMAAASVHPALVAAAKEIVSGKRGSLKERTQAAQDLSQAGLLPPGPIDLWSGDEKRPVMLMSFEISPEPVKSKLPRRAQALFEQAFAALQRQDGEEAEPLLQQALALAPDDPSLLNNLAMAYGMQGRESEARQMIQEVHRRFPDYFFGVLAAANMETEQGNLERARELLDGLMGRQKLHTSEFAALCQGQIQLLLAEGNREGARSWLEIWEQVDPGNPNLRRMRVKVGAKRKM